MVITLNTASYKHGTFGTLQVGDFSCCTVERPWLQNARGLSCVPAGEYKLKLRQSSVVKRTSRGAHLRGWEVTNVSDRTYIMIHVANKVSEVQGCIAVGQKFGVVDSRWAVIGSRNAFDLLMEVLSYEDEHTILIRRHVI